jgi:N-acetylmuramic acid 6-phosphate (MurNAc-6-P) etherase
MLVKNVLTTARGIKMGKLRENIMKAKIHDAH